MKPYTPSLIIRTIYAAFLISLLLRKDWYEFAFQGIIFVATLPAAFLGRKDIRFSIVDVFLLAIPGSVELLSHFHVALPPDIIGIDKLFHTAGGAAVATFAYFFYRTRMKSKLVLAIAIVSFTLALGAAWEWFEWIFLLLKHAAADYFNSMLFADTMLDMVADTLGAVIVAAVVTLFVKTSAE